MADTDDALFWGVAEHHIATGKATEGSLMNFPCVRVREEFVSMPEHRHGHLVAKLPAERVAELIGDGVGVPFGPGDKVFKEWVLIAERDEALWTTIFAEAVEFGEANADKKRQSSEGHEVSFTGFSPAGLDLLRTLGTKNKAWLDENRKHYEREVAVCSEGLCCSAGRGAARGCIPDIVASPKTNGSIGPINNDLRFKPDASPYKDHLLFRFWEGASKKTAPTLFIRLSPSDGIGIAKAV
ncbi:MAG: DUF2461 family protein [Acidimicrobiales bacterium]